MGKEKTERLFLLSLLSQLI